jgi:hypothetical protein
MPGPAHRLEVRSVGARRRAGIDRRTVGPALLVLALAIVSSVVLPSIDSATSYRDQVGRGDVAELADGLTLVPAVGWDLATGALVDRTRSPVGSTATTEVVDGSVELQVQAAPFDGSPAELLARVKEIEGDLARLQGGVAATSGPYAVRTRQGAVGVAQDFVGAHRQGTVVAFVLPSPVPASGAGAEAPGEGVAAVAAGPEGPISRRRDEIVAMIRSIRAGS